MKKTAILLLPILFLSLSLGAQIQAKTEDGKTVLLSEDGTWTYQEATEIAPAEEGDCEYTKNEIDDFSGDKTIITKRQKIGKTSIGSKVEGTLMFAGGQAGARIIVNADLGCTVSGDSKVQIKLTNGEALTFYNVSDTECEDYAAILFIFQDGDLMQDSDPERIEEVIAMLKEFPVDKLRVHGSDYYADVELSEEGKDFFRSHLSCIGL